MGESDFVQGGAEAAVAGEAGVPSSFLQGVVDRRKRCRRGGGKTSAEGKESEKKKKKIRRDGGKALLSYGQSWKTSGAYAFASSSRSAG